MKDGKCPKCGSGEVYVGGAYAAGNPVIVSASLFQSASLNVYVCTACGYTECYVEGQTVLRKIAEKWRRAEP